MTSPEELFGANASQVDMLMMLLDTFPDQSGNIRVAIPAKSRRPWAEDLVKRGVRVHPELMEKFPIPGDHPEAGWMNPHRWVPKAEYEEHFANRPPGDAEEQLRAMLEAINPAMAARISKMTDAEKQAERRRQEPEMSQLFEQMQEVGRKHWEQQHAGPASEQEG